MNVGAVGPVGSGAPSVYAALSPYLNGVRRTSDAAAAAQVRASAAAASAARTAAALAARAQAAATVPAAPPFLNPAIPVIAVRTTIVNAVAPAPPSPTDSVLHGDAGMLVQAYGAVALLAAPLAIASAYGLPATPAIPAVTPVTAPARVARVADSG
jgi:hypothetical protein